MQNLDKLHRKVDNNLKYSKFWKMINKLQKWQKKYIKYQYLIVKSR